MSRLRNLVRDLVGRYLPQGAALLSVLIFASYVMGLFRDRIFSLLAKEEDLYTECLAKHLGRHVKGLKMKAAKKRAAAVKA